jgi:hypothetical protein
MKNKVALIVVFILLAGSVYAIPYDDLKIAVLTALVEYLEDPSSATLTSDELTQLISFYFSIPAGTTDVTLPANIQSIYIKLTNCTPDCAGKECGDDGCGGSCGMCAEGESCQDGQCATCAISSIEWLANTAYEGERADFEVKSNSCISQSFDVEVWENDIFLDDHVEDIPITISSDDEVFSWVAKWVDDGIGNPEFVLRLEGKESNELEVVKAQQIGECKLPFTLPCVLPEEGSEEIESCTLPFKLPCKLS